MTVTRQELLALQAANAALMKFSAEYKARSAAFRLDDERTFKFAGGATVQFYPLENTTYWSIFRRVEGADRLRPVHVPTASQEMIKVVGYAMIQAGVNPVEALKNCGGDPQEWTKLFGRIVRVSGEFISLQEESQHLANQANVLYARYQQIEDRVRLLDLEAEVAELRKGQKLIARGVGSIIQSNVDEHIARHGRGLLPRPEVKK